MVKHTSVLKMLSDRFSRVKTIPSAGLFNQFIPFSRGEIAPKRISEDIDQSMKFKFEQVQQVLSLLMVSISQFVLCSYESHKLFGMACEVNTAHKDIEIKFMHPLCPSRFYTWLRRDGIYWLPTTNIFFLPKTQSMTTGIGRQSKIYPRCSTLISFYMMSINTVTNSMFLQQIKSLEV